MTETLNTITSRFAASCRRFANRPALSAKKGNLWQTLTYAEAGAQVRSFALGLTALGIQKGDRIAMLSENRIEWAVADLGALTAGAVTVPIYPSLPSAQILPLLTDSGAKAIVVSDAKQLHKVLSEADTPSALQIFIVMDALSSRDNVLSMEEVMQKGRQNESGKDEDLVQPQDLMSIIYTSGTTGLPKGVMLTHDNMCASLDGIQKDFTHFNPPEERFISFLPLSHIYERVVSCLSLTTGAHTFYNDSIFKLMDNMSETAPTLMTNVPRVYESIHERVLAEVSKLPARKQAWFRWAVEVGEHCAARQNAGKSLGPLWATQKALANQLVLSKIRAKFGGRLKFFVTGGAPLNPQTGAFFQALGTPILEGWGLTETTGPATVNPYGHVKLGTVGRVSSGSEVVTAADGELLVRGRTIMRGYWNQPEATAEVLDSSGWFHTGDIGEIDSQGYIRITDRKKNIIVLGNGKNVAPQPIETLLKHSPYIADLLLLGDRMGSISALILPDFDRLKNWSKEQEPGAADAATRRLFKQEIDRLSSGLADFERVKRFALLPAPLTIEKEELTPTLKIKRKVVSEKYGYLLERD